ncbi:MAG: glycosyltransferase family 4 protein [Hungatella sp.]|nr:glycosyltransferase family 4 protein [Hungatella sp.]
MKGIFITYGQGSAIDNTGVGLKIKGQINAFCQNGIDFFELTLLHSKNPMLRILYRLPLYNGYPIWKYRKEMDNVDCVYLRRPFVMTGYMRHVLQKIRKRNPKVKIVLEIPTYPYDKEIAHFKTSWLFLMRDRYNRVRLDAVVDRIVTVTKDNEIFGIQTIKIQNGIDVRNICPRTFNKEKKNEIHLCAVATFKEWHAYERLLFGMIDYYTNGGKIKVILHFIGEGQELPLYKKIVKEHNLEKFVFFHGYLTGEALDHIYNHFDIGIASLGMHRIGLTSSSALKTREYLARGLPIVSSLPIDVFEMHSFPYCLYVPQDESKISIEKIIEFYNTIYQRKDAEKVIKEIRKFALEYVDIERTMKPVVNFFKGI